MTKKEALIAALNTVPAENIEVREVLTKMIEQLSKTRVSTDEAKAALSKKRKAATAAARLKMVSQVIPILREVITEDMTAKEIFAAAKDKLPEDFSAAKVQNILIREMQPELIKTEKKGHANLYRRI